MYYYQMMNGGGWFIGLIGMIFWALLLAAVIMMIVRFARGSGRMYMDDRDREDRAIEIVRRRYAKGEITKEQFDQIKKDLAE